MKEAVVRRVMIEYFGLKGIKVIVSKGAGPDLLTDGKAVEVKGSKFDFNRMIKQLLDYAYKYSEVALALPFDALSFKEANQLGSLASIIAEARDIRLKVYVVAPNLSHENLFYVRDLDYAWEYEFHMRPSGLFGLDMRDPDSTIVEAVENLLRYSSANELRKYVCDEMTRKVSRVQI